MSQISFAEAEYENNRRKTRRELFLEEMDHLIPWKQLASQVKRYYAKSKTGRPPYALSVMLRIHCLQLIYNYSDPGMEDALYEIESLRRFAGLRLSDRIPDETTILNFRHLLEAHGLGETLFAEKKSGWGSYMVRPALQGKSLTGTQRKVAYIYPAFC